MSEKKKVLIAEDSSVIQNLTKKILQIQNYDISSAKNGNQVMEMVQKEDYDIILMDINMPGLDGMECSRRIRQMDDPKKKDVPIVAITGNAKNYSDEDFSQAGINQYIQKPLNFDEVVSAVRKFTS
ncbi:MAG TPA: histidine kinase [Cytophagales bacterium]|jgi:two-component system cell cycle response regulator DivK|nr:histidine kinase [Cytophagales bacterium]